MQCKRGIPVNGSRVPCGQCMPCRINKGRLMAGRILLEQAFTREHSWFLTFTVEEEKMRYTPEGHQTVDKEYLRDWVRSAQRKFGSFRHISIGEYGDETGRAHYHQVIFPTNPYQTQQVLATWKDGFVTASELNPQRARYIVGYNAKKMTKADDKRLHPGQEPEFKIASPGLGRAVVPALVQRYKTPAGKKILEERGDIERTMRFDGRIYPIDKYILDKVRKEHGIPLLHGERLLHEGYYGHHQTKEAEWDPLEAQTLEKFFKQKNRRRGRGQTAKI